MKRLLLAERGAAVAEFALVLPVLALLIFGIAKFGILFNNYIEMTDAVSSAERIFSTSRTVTTPYSSAVTVLAGTAAQLNAGSITVTASVNGTTCATSAANGTTTSGDGACSTALSAAAGKVSSMTATYPCDLTIYGFNFAGGTCTLTSQAQERVE